MSKGSVITVEYMAQAQSLVNEIQSANNQLYALNNKADTKPSGPALMSAPDKILNTPEQATVSGEEKTETAVSFVYSITNIDEQLVGKVL